MDRQTVPLELESTVAALRRLRQEVVDDAAELCSAWGRVLAEPTVLASAQNLAHFLALRRRDVTGLQADLSALGLSSLGRASLRVRANLDAVLATLEHVAGSTPTVAYPPREAHRLGERLIAHRSEQLFGPDPGGPATRIMVTLDCSRDADLERYVELMAAGADVCRINAAHETLEVWREHASVWRAAAARLGRRGIVQIDVAGPKCRIVEVDGDDPTRSKRLSRGDRFVLRRAAHKVSAAWRKASRASAIPAFESLLDDLHVGHQVFYDDGKLQAAVIDLSSEGVLCEVRGTREDGVRLRPEKGLNFPELELRLPILCDADTEALEFAAQDADLVGLSFVQRPEDVVALQHALDQLRGERPLPGLVLKIETRLGVRNLPRLIVQAFARQPVGVMIARGDLALELGFERLAEVQEEIVELCRAAHVPVVWATQVFEELVKQGWPTRAEASDAILAQAAQCVMLNKGPHQVAGVRMLDGILRRIDRLWHAGAPLLTSIDSWDPSQGVLEGATRGSA